MWFLFVESLKLYKLCLTGFEYDILSISINVIFLAPHPNKHLYTWHPKIPEPFNKYFFSFIIWVFKLRHILYFIKFIFKSTAFSAIVSELNICFKSTVIISNFWVVSFNSVILSFIGINFIFSKDNVKYLFWVLFIIISVIVSFWFSYRAFYINVGIDVCVVVKSFSKIVFSFNK